MNSFKKFSLSAVATAFLLAGCSKNLDLTPQNDNTADKVFDTPLGYTQAIAKVYGCIATTGNQGPAGSGDVSGDEGFSEFVRGFWNLQELPTDEALVSWADVGLPDIHNMSWSPSNGFIRQLYARSFYQISVANQFLKEATDDKINSKGFQASDVENIKFYRAEARFWRAYQYWVLMDLFGNVPFALEVSSTAPKQMQRDKVFAWIEGELKEIEPLLRAPRSNEYGRVDQAACWALMARLYLNAKVYSGTDRYADAATYAKKVIDAGYSLTPNYRNLMLADNDQVAKNEFILTVNYDGTRTQCYGGTTFLINASNGSEKYSFKAFDPVTADTVRQDITYGTGGWNGLKALKTLVGLFPDSGRTSSADKRAQFVDTYLGKTKSRPLKDSVRRKSIQIKTITNADEGVRVYKYRNVTSTGALGSDPSKTFGDADFPLFRLGEMYLIYAEAAARGAADQGLGLQYINTLRNRAYGDASGNVTSYDVNFVLDERARELYWEGHRRTDLIRYGLFTSGTYLWPFKGGQAEGKGVDDYRALYPLPSSDVIANPNLKQNTGY